MRAKVWSSKNPGKVTTASSFAIVHGKSEGKSIKHFITKTFSERPSSPWNKYDMYFYLVTYFMTAMLYLSVQFLRNIILDTSLSRLVIFTEAVTDVYVSMHDQD